MDTEVLIGALLVSLVACYRFNSPPPPKPSLPTGLPHPLLGAALKWFQLKSEPHSFLFYPPPRANTTLFKFWLYRMVYVMSGLALYLMLCQFPKLREVFELMISEVVGEHIPALRDAGPLVLAFIVSTIFPLVPPLKWAEASIRRVLYERASIPAQQLHERNRLKGAAFEVCPTMLEVVRSKLEAENFHRSDIVYEPTPTTRSLWTKISMLVGHIAAWQADDKYKTAFAVLKERDSDKLTVDGIEEAYEALKGDARVCFRSMRDYSGDEETQAREAAFRRDCRALLGRIYDLLSRVSLKSHFTDRERVRCMAKLGFKLTPRPGGPIPDTNDLTALALVLGCVLFIPLSIRLGNELALLSTGIMYMVVLTPIVIAHHFPEFAVASGNGTPAIAFPIASAIAAVTVGILMVVIFGPITVDAEGSLRFSIHAGWTLYSSDRHPWSLFYALISSLIAWRMRVSSYPDPIECKGIKRYQEWGNFYDAAIFAGCTLAVMIFLIAPKVHEIRQKVGQPTDGVAKAVIVATIIAFILGFLVPTWYRANALRKPKAQDSGPLILKGVLDAR